MDRLTIPSSMISAKLSQNVADLRARISEVSSEAVTGKRSDLTLHLSGRIGDAMLSQKALQDINTERGTLALREARLDMMQKSLTSVQESSDGLSARLLSAVGIGNQAEVTAVSRDASSALEQVFTSLNARHGERFLFAGDATSTQPFGDSETLLSDVRQIAIDATGTADFEARLDAYFDDPAGGWQQTIYQGHATVSDPDAVAGIDPAITRLIKGLSVMAVAGRDTTPALLKQSTAPLLAAADRVAEGQIKLTNLRGNLGTIQERIAKEQDTLNAEEVILNRVFNEMASRDQYEAATELQELENNLEASYLLTARLSNLSLLNFLR